MSDIIKKKLGIRIIITQETDDYSHKLYEIYDVHKLEKERFDTILFNLKDGAKKLSELF